MDGYASLGSTAAMTVLLGGGFGALLGVVGIVSRGQSLALARVFVAAAFGGGIAMVSLLLDLVAGQVDLADPAQAALGGPVLGFGLGLGAAVAVVAFILYKPGTINRPRDPNILALNAEERAADHPCSSKEKMPLPGVKPCASTSPWVHGSGH